MYEPRGAYTHDRHPAVGKLDLPRFGQGNNR